MTWVLVNFRSKVKVKWGIFGCLQIQNYVHIGSGCPASCFLFFHWHTCNLVTMWVIQVLWASCFDLCVEFDPNGTFCVDEPLSSEQTNLGIMMVNSADRLGGGEASDHRGGPAMEFWGGVTGVCVSPVPGPLCYCTGWRGRAWADTGPNL